MHIMTSAGLGLLGSALLLGPVTGQSQLTTNFAANNSLTSPGSNFFDITIMNKGGIVITSIDVNCENTRQGGIGTKFDVEVHITKAGGTYAGNEQKPAAWFLMAKGSSVSKAQQTPTSVDISDMFLPPGKYGMAVHYAIPAGATVGTAFAYTNGTGTNQSVSNADLKLDLGTSNSGKFTGGVFSPRVWNGTIHYEAGKNAAFGVYGVGCDGGSATGAPTIKPGSANPVPKIGGSLSLEVGNLATLAGVGFMWFGFSYDKWLGMTLPVDLGLIGLPGCLTYIPADIVTSFGHVGKSVVVTLPVPNTASLAGISFGVQAALLDGNAKPSGANATNLVAGRFGN